MKLKVKEQMWTPLCEQLLARQDVESAGLLFGEALATASGTVIAVREAMALPSDAYRIRRLDQLFIDPVAMNRLIRPARQRGLSIFTIHTHPGAASAWFSGADDAGDARLMPSLRCQVPNTPHGSMVLVNDGTVVARVFDEHGKCENIALQIVGRTLASADHVDDSAEPWFDRQALALGARGQSQLRRLRIAVVGLGGIGSMVSMQLAHLGVGALVLLDGDLVEASNLSRVVGATMNDIGCTYKVDVAARYARGVGLVGQVEVHREFMSAAHEALLGGCDIVVSCVDQHTPRAILNRLAYRYLIPVIDLGTVFRVDASSSRIVGDTGRVVVLGPGRPCLGCWGHIDPFFLLSSPVRWMLRRIGTPVAPDRGMQLAESLGPLILDREATAPSSRALATLVGWCRRRQKGVTRIAFLPVTQRPA
jgi:hypothetical protein